jgi:hypothetical protein
LVDISKEPIPVIKSLSETWKTERQEGNQWDQLIDDHDIKSPHRTKKEIAQWIFL